MQLVGSQRWVEASAVPSGDGSSGPPSLFRIVCGDEEVKNKTKLRRGGDGDSPTSALASGAL